MHIRSEALNPVLIAQGRTLLKYSLLESGLINNGDSNPAITVFGRPVCLEE